jgi:hypothetical protein
MLGEAKLISAEQTAHNLCGLLFQGVNAQTRTLPDWEEVRISPL